MLGSLFTLLGAPLVRAGRPQHAFYAGAGFAIFFALTVQPFLYAYPGWMYSYLLSEEVLPPGYVATPFFLAVSGAGIASAHVTVWLLRQGRAPVAVANLLGGALVLAAVWLATWDRYTALSPGYAAFIQGTRPSIFADASFQQLLNLAGVVQGFVGLSLAAWLVLEGRRATRFAAIQPDAAPTAWRAVADGPTVGPAEVPASPLVDGKLCGDSPADGEALPPVEALAPGEAPALLARARAAQQAWAALPLKARIGALRAVGKELLARADELVELLRRENGRPAAESWFFELLPTADLFDHWTGPGAVGLQGEPVELDPIAFPKKRGVIEKLPRGVVLVIAPWNLPVNLPLRTILPALLAGNAVVFKASEFTPRCAAFLVELFARHLPKDVVLLAPGAGELGAALIEAGPDFISFTGSPKTGRRVAEAAARQLVPCALELGGKDAAIVLDDAPMPRTAKGLVWGAFANAGQNCAAVERVYVLRPLASTLIEQLRREIEQLRSGPGGAGEVDVGPMTTIGQRELVRAQLAEAKARGVEFRTGKSEPVGNHFAPVLLVDPPEDLALCREESFGPILPVFTVDSIDEAVRRANDTPYGLTASVWGKDLLRAEGVARRLVAGVVTVNNHAFTGGVAAAPWGGTRGSGYGVTNSPRVLDEVTRPRFVLIDAANGKREPWWQPYDQSALQLGRGMARLRRGELGALPDVVRGFLKRGG